MSAIRNFVKSRTTYALRFAVRQIGKELAFNLHHILAVQKARWLRPPLRLNLGCGPNAKPGWINIDFFDSRADLRLDVRKRWPFPNGSVSQVYSEHVFEHLEIVKPNLTTSTTTFGRVNSTNTPGTKKRSERRWKGLVSFPLTGVNTTPH
jgi:hypothetical protein